MSSLHDGMNLVAKEYVASQPPNDPGVLVLSSFAGAADELKQAIVINPSDPEDFVEAIDAALTMRQSERSERWATMFEHLVRNDVTAWRNAFLSALLPEVERCLPDWQKVVARDPAAISPK